MVQETHLLMWRSFSSSPFSLYVVAYNLPVVIRACCIYILALWVKLSFVSYIKQPRKDLLEGYSPPGSLWNANRQYSHPKITDPIARHFTPFLVHNPPFTQCTLDPVLQPTAYYSASISPYVWRAVFALEQTRWYVSQVTYRKRITESHPFLLCFSEGGNCRDILAE